MQIQGPHHDTCMFFYTNQGKYERGGNCGKYVGYYWQRQLVGDQLWGRLCLTTHKEKWKLPKTIGCRILWKIIFLQQMCSTISKLPFSTAAQPNWSFVEICIWYVYGVLCIWQGLPKTIWLWGVLIEVIWWWFLTNCIFQIVVKRIQCTILLM